MKSLMTLSEDSGILIFSESYSNDEKVSDSLSDIQLSSSLFALFKLSCTNRALRWLRKGDSLLLFRTTNSSPAPPDNTTHSVGGLLVIVVFDAAFNDDEAANIADLVTNLLREQILPPNENLRQSQKRLLSAALLSLYGRILSDLFSKLVTAKSGEMLGAVSSSTSASMHIVMYRKFSPLSPSDADFNPLGDRDTEMVMRRDDTGSVNESVRMPEEPSYTGAQPPVPVPMPVSMNSPLKEYRKVPLWRILFQHMCCAPTSTARPTAESLSAAKGVSVSGCTVPTAALDPTLSSNTHDHNTPNLYGGKYLLLRPSDRMVTREDASVVTRAGAAHRQLILLSEMKIGKILESRSICNGRSVFSLSPEVMKVRLGKRSLRSDSHPKGEHEASQCGEAELSQDAAFLQGLEVADANADADWREVECLFKIAVVAYQDLRVLLCTPSTAASDTVAANSMNSEISTEVAGAGAGTGVEGKVGARAGSGTAAGAVAERILCSPVIRTLSPASLAAWKHYYIFCSICLGGVPNDASSCQSVRSRSLQRNMDQNEQQLRL